MLANWGNGLLTVLLGVWLVCPGLAQDRDLSLTDQLIDAYERFDNSETDRLLSVALGSIDSFSPADRLNIYKYAAFRATEQQSSTIARSFFWRLLEIDPTYELDPVKTSPKIITLFQQAQVDYLSSLKTRLDSLKAVSPTTQLAEIPQPPPWRSLLWPGWEQYRRGYRLKGVVWAALGLTAVAGTVQSIITTRQRRDAYNLASDPSVITFRYDRYRSAYQSQFYWSYGLAALWVAAHLDASFLSPPKSLPQLTVFSSAQAAGISLKLSL